MNASIPRSRFDMETIEMSATIAAEDRLLAPGSNEKLQIAKFVLYLYEGPRRGRSLWMHLEAELSAMWSEGQATAIDYTEVHPTEAKDLS